jgi:uncharacterized protein
MEQRISLITLGVADLQRARSFYEELGWRAASTESPDVVFFQAGCMVLALWGREELARDSAVGDPGGWGGVTLAHNLHSATQVDELISRAELAGATIGRRPAETAWGGYSGVFVDLDGHPWEVAHNPHWEMTAEGEIRLP